VIDLGCSFEMTDLTHLKVMHVVTC